MRVESNHGNIVVIRKKKHKFYVKYRFVKKAVNLYRMSVVYAVKVRYRFIRRVRFKITRIIVFLFFRLWIKDLAGFENIPLEGPAILASNHLSYYDFLILGALFRKQIVFVAVKKIKQTPFIQWFTKLHVVIYVDRDHPGTAFFRKIMECFEANKLVVIYPEGTRSRNKKMLKPKHGFVKLAMAANVPIIPVAMKGTYEILPPHRNIPRFTKCKVVVGKRMYISPGNPDFTDVFFEQRGNRKFSKLTNQQLQKIAIRIMDKVRLLADEVWEDSVISEVNKALLKKG